MSSERWLLAGLAATFLAAACGGSPPVGPTRPPDPVFPPNPPANNPPVIESITVQGSRLRQPANFADLGEAGAD